MSFPEEAEAPLAVRVARSALWSIGGQAAILIASFLAAPFTIRLLGPAAYGLWSLLVSLRSYFALADLGMATGSTRFAAQRYALGDARGEAAAIWTATAITTTLTGIAAVAGVIAAPALLSDVLHIHGALYHDGLIAMRVLFLAAIPFAMVTTINTPQQVRLRWRSLTLATSGPAVVQVAAAPLVLVAIDRNVIPLAALTLAANLAAVLANLFIARRLQPALSLVRVQRALLGPLSRYGAALAISGFASIPLANAERFLLGYFRSPTVVAYYAVAATLGSMLVIIPAAAAQPMLPALTRLAAQGQTDAHRRLYGQVLQGVFAIATPVAVLMAFVAQPFLTVWAGPAYGDHSTTPFYIVLVGCWFATLSYVATAQLLAAGRPGVMAVIHVSELLPYLALAAVLTSAWGATGAAAAWTARCAADTVIFFLVVRRRNRLPWKPTPDRALASMLLIAGLGVCCLGLAFLTSSLVLRALCAVALAPAYAAAAWLLVFTPTEREALGGLIRQLPGVGRRVPW